MKINWGHKILFVYLLFVGGIVFLAILSSQQKFDLVQKDYYGAELKYQQVIDASSRAQQQIGDIQIAVKDKNIFIQLPAAFKGKKIKGVAYLYFAADEQKDIKQSFNCSNASVIVPLNTKTKGNYTLKLDVMEAGVSYYFEQKIFL